jgi:hypothetical protein
MKCPYRKITIEKIDSTGAKVTKEEFGDCYEFNCPFYENHFSSCVCIRATYEYKQK